MSMSLSVGIVGLPNVGKSTLFNALLRHQQALAANYPFATIEPNTGIVPVPDERLEQLAAVVEKEEKLEPGAVPLKAATIEFVDIAGLVKGAAEGEGLGNQFLANIRECDLICHVLRTFKDPDVVVTGKLNPVEDLATVRSELILKDLETVEKQEKEIFKSSSSATKGAYEKALKFLNKGKMMSWVEWNDKEWSWLKTLNLLTAKPEIFVLNASEDQLGKTDVVALAKEIGAKVEDVVVISAKVESELAVLSVQDQKDYLKDLGLESSGIERMAQAAYRKLNLISFLTAGVKEIRAWTVKKGTAAVEAAGVIHSDFEANFIKAKVIFWEEFVSLGGWKRAAQAGKVRQEGRKYQVSDGDVIEFMVGK